jgi:LmeA-like phospholipid-binding
MTSDSPDMGEKALSKITELGIASQLDKVENIDIDIRTNPVSLVQGKLDSVSISGQGLVMKQDLRMEALDIKTDKVSINPLSAVFGNVELIHPTDAEAQIVLNEADINHAFESSYIQSKLKNLSMDIDGQSELVDIQNVSLHLPGENKFAINADFLIQNQSEPKKISVEAMPQVCEDGNQISLDILSAECKGLSNKIMAVILNQLTALLDLRNFDIPGMSLQLERLEAQDGQLVIHANTQIQQFPSS